jgi:plastocyanin
MKKVILATVLLLMLNTIMFLYIFPPYGSGSHITVIISEKGFIPDFIRISPGTTITWVNQDETPHWPASDFHPSHSQYPTKEKGCLGSMLDVCHSMDKDEQYSFTFSKKGNWGIHDHLYPATSMTVEVTDNLLFASTHAFIASLFQGRSTDLPSSNSFLELNYPDQLKAIKKASSKDPQKTWEYLKEAYLKDNQTLEISEVVASDSSGLDHVHIFAHIVGNEAYKLYGIDALSFCDYRFSYGCLHGASGQMLLELGIDAVDKCIESKGSERCIHGLGHGLLVWREYDIQSAVKDCDMMHKSYRFGCYDGIFMEYAWTAPKKQLKSINPTQLCATFPQSARTACASYVISIFMRGFDLSFTRAAQECLNAQDKIVHDGCSPGTRAADFARGNLDKIIEYCTPFKSKERDSCLMHAATETKYKFYYNWEVTTAVLCNAIPQPMQDACFPRSTRFLRRLI